MTEENVVEILLYLLKEHRTQAELLDDLGAQLQAIYDYLEQRDSEFSETFEKRENEAKAATSFPKRLMLQKLDDTIRQVESLRKPRLN